MGRRTNLRQGDRIIICGREYQLVQNMGALRGFQFRTWLVKSTESQKEYVVKATEDQSRALSELRMYIYLKTERYPERYYAEMVAFDHEAAVVRDDSSLKRKFSALLLTYLPPGRFQPLDQYLKKGQAAGHEVRVKLANKLRRRVARLHELRVSHGDLRPANIMVRVSLGGRTGVRIIDFGLSTFSDEQVIGKDNRKVDRIVQKIVGQELAWGAEPAGGN